MMIFLAAATFMIAALKAFAHRRGAARGERAVIPDGSGLPPVSRAEVQAVMRNAEKAALRQAREGRSTPNPQQPGTRAHIIWAAHYGATLLDLENER
ncbi:MAG: hypothetical protein ABI919_02985 [Ramlibacter sp.]